MKLDIDFNMSVKPSDDFFSYVNSEWIKKNPIPFDFSIWGSFVILSEENRKKVKEILEENYPTSDKYHRLNVLYFQGLDEEKRKNISEVYKYVSEIRSCDSISKLLKLIIDYQMSWNIESPIRLTVYNDFDDSTISILHLFTAGLGLPDRDYYLLDDKSKERNEYKKFLVNFNSYFDLSLDLDGIFNLEKQLAQYTHTKVEKRKPELLRNPRTLDQILQEYPSFDFLSYFFEKIELQPGKINISNPVFFANLNKLFYEVGLNLWKDYFVYKFLHTVSSYLSTDLEKLVFDFYGKTLSGTPEMKPLWKRTIDNTENQLGQLIGKKYVEGHFSENAKKEALEMIKYLKNELRTSITNLDWMDDTSKSKALEKLDMMNIKVGYPDVWREYKSELSFSNSYLLNNLLCNKDDNEYRFNKLYKPVDKNEWFMDPHLVNAYYSPSFNEIVFPAGILQPPFFSEEYDKALNFGGIGTVIGHEMTHGFDDEGCKFDGKGNLNIWCSEQDKKNFKNKTDTVKNQFNQYQIEGNQVNGELTLGENIADLGGVFISLEGFKKYLLQHPGENVPLDGFTPIQRFFLSYARIWRYSIRAEEMKKRLIIDPHSPPELRVNGILKNIDDFYTAFNVLESDKLYLDKSSRAKIW